MALYADRTGRRWGLRDADGAFWLLSPTDTPWRGRQPFPPAEGTDLEPVPGHDKPLLGRPTEPERVLR